MQSARVVLTNAKAGDALPFGTLPAGITAALNTSVAGVIPLMLTGMASLAAHQFALQAVRLRNTSNAPDIPLRVIEVTVNDDLSDSAPATTTITVVAVNDAPNAGNDTVLANVSGSIALPEWVLALNDADPDGSQPLDITAAAVQGNAAGIAVTSANGVDPLRVNHTSANSRTLRYAGADGAATDTATITLSRDATGPLNGGNGNDILVGGAAPDSIEGGRGDDMVLAGAVDDRITWSASGFGNDGRDILDGGTEGAAGNTFVISGNNLAETFDINAPGTYPGAVTAWTEIVITRNGTVIAKLREMERIVLNTNGAALAATMTRSSSTVISPARTLR